LEGSAVPNGVLEVPAIPEGVAHVLVVETLGVDDVVQCTFASSGCSSGARGAVWRRGLLHEASSPNVCRVVGSCRIGVPPVQALLLR
jgi:hypothetical protein